jgi:hypothetical protein
MLLNYSAAFDFPTKDVVRFLMPTMSVFRINVNMPYTIEPAHASTSDPFHLPKQALDLVPMLLLL